MEALQVTNKQNVVVAIDPGSAQSGVVVLTDGKITHAETSSNEEIMTLIRPFLGKRYKLRVMIEDIRPYSLQLTPDVVETCKYIGELRYRLNTARISFEMISRSEIKEWAYLAYKSQIEPLILKKMEKKGKNLNLDGNTRKTSFVWIDDQIITHAMRFEWSIPAERGRSNRFGLATHSWQALALGTLFLKGAVPKILKDRKTREIRKQKAKLAKKMKRLKIKEPVIEPALF